MSSDVSNTTVRRRPWLDWALVLLLAAIWCAPLTYPGYFVVHQGFLPVFDLYDLENAGSVWTWAPTVGTEYDLLRGDGALPYLFAEIARWLGAGGVGAVKLTLAVAVLLGAAGMYAWTRQLLGRIGALLSSAIYACWPVVLSAVYVRGAFAEALFLGLLPWSLWSMQRLLHRRGWWAVPVGVAIALLCWTQAGLALWAVVILLAYGLGSRPSRWPWTLGATAGGVLTGFLGLWPLFAARGLGSLGTGFTDHFLYLYQLLSAQWGRGVSQPGWQDDLPLQLGLAATGLAALGLLSFAAARSSRSQEKTEDSQYGTSLQQAAPTVWTSLGLALGLVFLSTTLSAPLWVLPPLAQASRALTYPWQLLVLLGPFLALLGGLAASAGLPWIRGSDRFPLWTALIVLVLLGSYGYLQPETTGYEPGAKPVAFLGDHDVMLLDARIDASLAPGRRVEVTVHWQPLRPLSKDYSVFVHAVDETEARWGQQDTQPQSGAYPTSQWQMGEIIEDSYELNISSEAPAADIRLHLGLYDWETGDRLRVGDDDKVVLRQSE